MSAPSATGQVVTVTGPVDPRSLGHTVTSVHLVSDLNGLSEADANGLSEGGANGVFEAGVDEEPVSMELLGALALGALNRDDRRLTAADVRPELADFAALGGGAVVEVTGADLGRAPRVLADLARATGVAVVMGCGGYSPSRTPGLADRTVESLTAEIIGELREGVDGVRAGVIGEIEGLDPDRPADRVLVAAVAHAARRTGAPVLIDRAATAAATHGLLDLMDASGAGLGRVAVGHCDGLATDADALARLADRGVFLQFDGLGRLPTVNREVDDQDVAAAVLDLAERGHAEQILLSPRVARKIDLKAFGGGGYGFVAEQFVPYLGYLGADEALLSTLTESNPRRWLTMTEGRG
ncbi:phosphotriesterase [Actinomadura sp. KC06]|uniref:phosphotriesterase family protein n=1 Tax=Actinomadura sp. KC06 TaxID=2530369 RepID=UPI00105276BD|nr:phosphotriesterase [Actinomadura sp. KC06]TDD35651.1 phosphotriesterase [Actinomadura sp. KC06]